MVLRLYTSNRLEILADQLSQVLLTPLPSPFDREVIVVQSKGMERWISMQLAQRHGICANVHFPFPNHFVQEVFRKAIPDFPEHTPYDPKTMTWRIMKLLPSCISKPGFESLGLYLQDRRENLKRLQLSEQIADIFDQYLIFRPEMIFRWEKGHEDHWQAMLWRELVKGHEREHRAALARSFFEAITKFKDEIQGLPERISVFGISALPRFHVQVLAGVSRFTQVNLFLMNPCRAYWADILSEREIKRALIKPGSPVLTPEELHLEKGNSLLASMGTLGRDFFSLIHEFEHVETASFEKPGEKDLLSCIQSDILNLRERPQIIHRRKGIAPDDFSVQIHSCHSPMREMEILQDQLLHMFEENPALKPHDVLVMTPDIETYSPYIQAVFDLSADDPKRIPFSIADRSVSKEGEVIEPFMAIMDLHGSRYGASQVMAILEFTAVQRRFGLQETDLDLIRKWIGETRIRWGMDESNRLELGLPPIPENTWRAGLERLLLGYAMPGCDENMFQGILPFDHLEGDETLVLGRFLEFTDQLFSSTVDLAQPRTLDNWSRFLTGHLDRFMMSDEDTEREMQFVRQTLNELAEIGKIWSFDEEMDIGAIRWILMHAFHREGLGFGFMSGGMTFCAMLPMRSIPFKVICLVGMNGDAYPRLSQPVSFDIMSREPRPGDRSLRNDDRYLFLEALLSARETLYISYVGQSIQDNSPIPPSVLVSELTDYIEQGFNVEKKTILDRLMTHHRLQAFSQEYFRENGRLFSYSEENHEAAQCLSQSTPPPVPFIPRGLAAPDETWKTVDLEDLFRFFTNPAKFLLSRRLGITLEEKAWIMEEREAFDLKGLERYMIEEELLEKALAGRKLRDLLPLFRASGRLPHGHIGECLFEGSIMGIERFMAITRACMQGTPLDPLRVDIPLSGFRVTGRLQPIYPERLIRYRYARIRPKDHLRVWIDHLVLNLLRPLNYPRTSLLAGLNPDKRQDPVWTGWGYAPVENSEEILGKLLEKYRSGLISPLHFFPESSWEYAKFILQGGRSGADALGRARSIWLGSDYSRGECEDPYYQLCFPYVDPLDLEFQNHAEDVFEPIMKHQKKMDL